MSLPELPGGHVLVITEALPARSAADVMLGGKLWQAAPILCEWLRDNPEHVVAKSVLDLGAGVGACGLYAAALGAKAVLLTEGGNPPHHQRALEGLMHANLESNRALMGACRSVAVCELTWSSEAAAAAVSEHGSFDLVIASDVTWCGDDGSHQALCECLRQLLLSPHAPFCLLSMQHGLRVHTDDDDAMWVDETLEQFRTVASEHGLRLCSHAPDGERELSRIFREADVETCFVMQVKVEETSR